MKRVWLPGRGPVCQVSPRQSFMTKYAIKPFERGAYNRSLHRPSPLRGSTWCCYVQGDCGAFMSCSVLSRRHFPVAGTGSPLLTRAAPRGAQPCPDPNGILRVWDALLPPPWPCRRGREHGWVVRGCCPTAACPQALAILGCPHVPQPLGGVAGGDALTRQNDRLQTKPLLCAWGGSLASAPVLGERT